MSESAQLTGPCVSLSKSRVALVLGWRCACVLLMAAPPGMYAAGPSPAPATDTTLAQLVIAIRAKAKTLENSVGAREGFQSFTTTFKLQAGAVSFSDYIVARLLFEATRDAGF